MRQQRADEARGGKHDEGPHECCEGRGVHDLDDRQQSADDGAHDRCVEGVAEARVDLTYPVRVRDCVVACERVQHAAGGEVAADAGAEGGEKDDDEETEGAAAGVGRLAVDFA